MEEKKIVALTFDDGPNTTTTLEVLDKLEKYKVKASFFLIGNQITEDTIPVIKREVNLGCEISNHSMTHSFMDKLDKKVIEEEIRDTSAKITEITGKEPLFFRPPYIAVNDLMYEVIDLPFICGQGVEDWEPSVSANERSRRVLEQTVDGSIILLHDMDGNNNTVEALDTIIPELLERGFEFVTVKELFNAKNIPIQKNPGTIYSVVEN